MRFLTYIGIGFIAVSISLLSEKVRKKHREAAKDPKAKKTKNTKLSDVPVWASVGVLILGLALAFCPGIRHLVVISSLNAKISGQQVILNHTSYKFTEGLSFKKEFLSTPIRASEVAVYNGEEHLGLYVDGYYKEAITKDNIAKASKTILEAIHGSKAPDIPFAAFNQGNTIWMLELPLKNGEGVLLMKMNTKEFAYILMSREEDGKLATPLYDCTSEIVLQMGGQRDHIVFYGR